MADDEEPEILFVQERVVLEASGIPAKKDKIQETIRQEYRKVLRTLAREAKPGSNLKQSLEDATQASGKAAPGRLLDRHENLWGAHLRNAKTQAANQLNWTRQMVELLGKVGNRQADVDDMDRIEGRAITRYETACELQERATLLIKDLKAHLPIGS